MGIRKNDFRKNKKKPLFENLQIEFHPQLGDKIELIEKEGDTIRPQVVDLKSSLPTIEEIEQNLLNET